MLESIFVGMTGLAGYQRGLRVIAGNTANLGTPGFKAATLQFADLLHPAGRDAGGAALGAGVDTRAASLNFRQGELRQTGNDLDLAIDGEGLFMVRDEAGGMHYTRAGQFQFDIQGVLVSRTSGGKVMGVDAAGALVEISLAGLRASAARPTATVAFAGNLSSTVTEQVVGGVRVLDAGGASHELSVRLRAQGEDAPGRWNVTLEEGTAVVGTGALAFVDGRPAGGEARVSLTYRPPGQAEVPLVLDFGGDVTSFAAGELSTLAMASQDGVAAGGLVKAGFDASGVLALDYSNGQTAQGPRLALARFDSLDAVAAEGDNAFRALDDRAWRRGVAGEGAFGQVRAGVIELSNVDLSQEFSDLIVMQRGYQASSQVIATASDMLQELFGMKGR